MRFWWVLALAGLTGIAAYNYGYKRGVEDAPETAQAQIEKAGAEAEIARLGFETARKIAPTVEECLPLVLEDTIDLSGFCANRLAEDEQREHERLNENGGGHDQFE